MTDYAAQLTATAHERCYRIRRGAHSRLFIERQNRIDGTWTRYAREGSDRWNRVFDTVKRGWATIVSNEE